MRSERSGTGFKGVALNHRGKYQATIQVDGKQRKQSFTTPEEAALCVARSLGAAGAAAQAAEARVTAARPRPPPMTRSEALAAAAAEGITLLSSSSGTGFKGVTKVGNSYKASVCVPRTRQLRFLGSFVSAEAAALCYARHLGPERVAAQVEEASRLPLTAEEVLALAAREGLCLVRSTHETHETGFTGVKKHCQKFQAVFGSKYLGAFPTAEEAALTYARSLKAERAAAEAAAAVVAMGSAAARAEVAEEVVAVAADEAPNEAANAAAAASQLRASQEPVPLTQVQPWRGNGRARGRGGRPRGGIGRGGGGRGRGGGGGRTSAGRPTSAGDGGRTSSAGTVGPVIDGGSSTKKRKRRTLVEAALDARLKLARSERFAYDADGEGRGRAFKKKSLKVALQLIHDHVARHMGAGFDLRKLHFVRVPELLVRSERIYVSAARPLIPGPEPVHHRQLTVYTCVRAARTLLLDPTCQRAEALRLIHEGLQPVTRVLTCPVNVAASTRSTSQPPASGIHSVACGLRLLRREVLQPEIQPGLYGAVQAGPSRERRGGLELNVKARRQRGHVLPDERLVS